MNRKTSCRPSGLPSGPAALYRRARITSAPLALAVVFSAVAPQFAHAQARQVVVLPGVVGPVGESFGVDTQGSGLLTVGNQNINTENNAGGGITTDAANTATILFSGTSTVTGFVGSTGTTFLHIDAGDDNNTVNFDGQVFSTTFTLMGAGTVNFNQGFVSLTGSTVDFAGDGLITLGANQTLMGAITNTAGAQTGTLRLGADSIVDGAVGAASGLREIRLHGGNALITGEANSYMYTLGTNTLNVAGAMAIPVAGTINTTIFNGTTFGRIVPVGAATIGDNLLVNVTVTGVIPDQAQFNIVDATSGTDGATVEVTSNSALYQFAAAPTQGGLVTLVATRLPTAVVITTTPGLPPVAPIATAIDDLPDTPATTALQDALARLSTAEELASGLAQLGPGASNLNAPRASDSATRRFQDRIALHLDTCFAGSASHVANEGGDDLDAESNGDPHVDVSDCHIGRRFWVTGLGSTGRQSGRDGIEGYDLTSYGILLGYDAPIFADDVRGGVALGYARSEIDGRTFDNETDIDSYQGTVYIGYTPGPWFVNGGATIGTDRYSSTRRVVLPEFDTTADASYDGMQYGVFANTGYRIKVGERTQITPNAGLRYTHLTTDSYTESGGNGTNLSVDSESYDFLQSRVGVKASHDVGISETMLLRPQVHANWLHALGDNRMSNTASFTAGGAPFEVSGVEVSRDSYNVGASVALLGEGSWSLAAGYDLYFASSYTAHQGSLNLVLNF